MKRRSYSWALLVDEASAARLSAQARIGLEDAQRIARNARERSLAALSGDVLPERLTVREIAAEGHEFPGSVHARIRQARAELFGTLSDTGIYYRLRHREQLEERKHRLCAEPGCTNPLPANATRRRRYCDEHAAPVARTRRHRRRTAPG